MDKPNILLVDGDDRSRRVLEVSLRKVGFMVTTAEDGTRAIEELGLATPDLLIADTELMGVSGLDLCRRLKEHPQLAHVPVLFLARRGAVDVRVEALRCGADDVLLKPIFVKEIIVRIKMLLERQSRERLAAGEERSFGGDLGDMAVIDVIQTLELGQKSGIAHFRHADDRGAIFFRDGKIVDAELGRLQGRSAVFRLLLWNTGQFEVELKVIRRKDVIGVDNQALLLEGMRRVDEWGLLLEQLPPLDAVFELDYNLLGQRLGEIPDEVNSIIRLFDGRRTLMQVVDDSDFGDLEALEVVSKLYFEGLVYDAARGPVDRRGAAAGTGAPAGAPKSAAEAFARALRRETGEHAPLGTRPYGVSSPERQAMSAFASPVAYVDDAGDAQAADAFGQAAQAAAAAATPAAALFEDGRTTDPYQAVLQPPAPAPAEPPGVEPPPPTGSSSYHAAVDAAAPRPPTGPAAPVAEAPAGEAPVDEPLADEAPVDEPLADEAPVDAPAGEAPVDEAPADEAPVDEAPADEAPVDEAPAGEAPVDEPLADEAPIDQAPAGDSASADAADDDSVEGAAERGAAADADEALADVSAEERPSSEEEELDAWLAESRKEEDEAEVIPFPGKGRAVPARGEGDESDRDDKPEDPSEASINVRDEEFFASDYEPEAFEFDDESFIERRRRSRAIAFAVAGAAALLLLLGGGGWYWYSNYNKYVGSGRDDLQIRSGARSGSTAGSGEGTSAESRKPATTTTSADLAAVAAPPVDAGGAAVARPAPDTAAKPDAASATPPAKDDAYSKLIAEARAYFAKRRRHNVRLLTKALKLNPEGWEALSPLAWRAYNRGRSAKAARLARKALRGNPQAPYANLVIGAIAHEKGKKAEAKAGYRTFLQQCGKCREARDIRAALHQL